VKFFLLTKKNQEDIYNNIQYRRESTTERERRYGCVEIEIGAAHCHPHTHTLPDRRSRSSLAGRRAHEGVAVNISLPLAAGS
jgi:hypothetical protein